MGLHPNRTDTFGSGSALAHIDGLDGEVAACRLLAATIRDLLEGDQPRASEGNVPNPTGLVGKAGELLEKVRSLRGELEYISGRLGCPPLTINALVATPTIFG